jgi:hypothetical protein
MAKGDEGRPAAGSAKPAGNDKAERLAAALRANLKRRKVQARDRAEIGRESPETDPKTR